MAHQNDEAVRNDRFMLLVLGCSFLVSLALAFWYNTWVESLVIGVLSFGGAVTMYGVAAGTLLSRLTNAIALMTFVALHIHQGRGMIELHFGVFVGLALLFAYRDWRPLLAAAALIAVHHVLFNAMQAQGVPVWVFDNDRLGWNIVFIHALYVVVETAALIWLAIISKEQARVSQEIVAAASLVQKHDGSMDLSVRTRAEGSEVLASFNAMMESLQAVIVDTKSVLQELIAVTRHARDSNQQLEKMSCDKVELSEQIAVSMDELTKSVVSISDNAQQTSHSTDEAVVENRHCLQQVNETQESVRALSASLRGAGEKIAALAVNCVDIVAVVDVIQGIAEQTNLLALNAAIEAARAGEQGRGFAVVADEVRALASRTYDSTKEINNLIKSLQLGSNDAVSAMEDCQQRVDLTEQQSADMVIRLSEINQSLDRVSGMIQQIAVAVEEQSMVSREVASTTSSIKNASLEVSDYASTGLDKSRLAETLVSDLQSKLDAFRVGS